MSDDERVAFERRMATAEAEIKAMATTLDALAVSHRKLVQQIITAIMGSIALIGTSIWQSVRGKL